MKIDSKQAERNEAAIDSALSHIRSLGIIFNRYDRDTLDEQLDAVMREAKEAQHRLWCDDCRGEDV